MMKFIFMMLFMIPLTFSGSNFWLLQVLYFLMFVLFLGANSYDYTFSCISYFLGCDLLSYIMILLSFWVCGLMITASYKVYKTSYFSGLFHVVLLFLMIFLYLAFGSMNLMGFYLFFEASLIPTLILIMGWGYQPERLQAGVYLLFYTLFASLPMMISIFYYYSFNNSLDFFFMFYTIDSVMLFLLMSVVFFVKMPMYFVHLWLPKAHVEAPVSGSMILAGVMLKMGGYGLMRVMPIFLPVGVRFSFIFMGISLVGGFIVSLICLRQVDMKALIAYSSVAHMGLVLGGIMTMSYWGMVGSLVMMVAHGLCSSGLFCLANISYERVGSRSLYLNKGLINLMPGFTLWWFLLSSSNMAAPPSLNLAGEIMLINSLVDWSFVSMLFLSLISFFSAVYSLYLYSYTQHGKIYSGMYSFSSGSIREYLLLNLHWLPLNLLVIKGQLFTWL